MKASFALAVLSALCALTTYSTVPVLPLAPGSVPYTLCADWASPAITVKSLMYSPNPPQISQPFTVIANGDLSAIVTQGAKLTVVATLGGMTVSSVTIDVCTEVAKSGLNCPINIGNHDLTSVVPIPDGVSIPPFVTIAVHAEAYNGDSSRLFCLDTTAKFEP